MVKVLEVYILNLHFELGWKKSGFSRKKPNPLGFFGLCFFLVFGFFIKKNRDFSEFFLVVLILNFFLSLFYHCK